MKRLFLTLLLILTVRLAVQAQSQTGSVRKETFTVEPNGDGYVVQVTFTYRFQVCAGDITLDGYRSSHTPLA
ncbi:MAG: hypothetical protein LBB62_05395, partial [Proteiniphilum sp.]|nr:hypothetical protein [Proteiniphilum sp.]